MTVWLEVHGLDCQSCSEDQQIDRGCEEGSAPGQYCMDNLNEQFDNCPGKYATAQSKAYIEAYFFFKQGYLPNPGGWLDQPAKLLQAIKVVTVEMENVKEWRQKQAERR